MPPIDTTTPTDNHLLNAFPGNERSHRTTVKALIEAEHDGTSGRHKIPVVTNAAARDVLFTAPINGNLCYRRHTDQLEIYDSGVPAWVSVQPATAPITHDFGLMNATLAWESVSQVRLNRDVGGVLQVEIDGVVLTAGLSILFDIASHLDIGPEAASTFYYLYLENVAGVLTPHVSATGPEVTGGSKVGYHSANPTWRYVAAVWNTAALNFERFSARRGAGGRFEMIVNTRTGSAIPAEGVVEHATVQDADVSAFLPVTAREALIHAEMNSVNLRFHLFKGDRIGEAITSTSKGPYTPWTIDSDSDTWLSLNAWLPTSTSRHIGYARTRLAGPVGGYGAASHEFSVYGWRDW